MIAIGAISIAWFSSQDFKGKQKQEAELSPLLFSWGMLWWLVAGIVQPTLNTKTTKKATFISSILPSIIIYDYFSSKMFIIPF